MPDKPMIALKLVIVILKRSERMRKAILFSFLIAILAPASPAQQPSFDVASVKPNGPNGGSMVIGCGDGAQYGIGPGKCKAVNASLRTIIAVAYDIQPRLAGQYISGAPGWIGEERYDIEGKSEDGSVTPAQLRLMLRNLLADRFRLSLHEETKEVSGYALVVAKGGPKSRPLTTKPTRVACGVQNTEALARCLSSRLGQPVVDKTNITGNHNFSLTLESLGEDQPNPPSIFTVLQEELGLKLESGKVPLRILVIDHVEKPTEN
jgi:uncharacterized protein (TIGR03435 family)